MGPEQAIQKSVLDFLAVKKLQVKAQGGNLWFGKMHTGPLLVGNGRKIPNPMAGFPDVPCLYRRKGETRGQFIGFEVKPPGKKLSPDQVEMHEALTEAGAIMLVVESMDDVAAFFGEYDHRWRKREGVKS